MADPCPCRQSRRVWCEQSWSARRSWSGRSVVVVSERSRRNQNTIRLNWSQINKPRPWVAKHAHGQTSGTLTHLLAREIVLTDREAEFSKTQQLHVYGQVHKSWRGKKSVRVRALPAWLLWLLFIKKSSSGESLTSAVIVGIYCSGQGRLATSRSRKDLEKYFEESEREKKKKKSDRVFHKNLFTHTDTHARFRRVFCAVLYSQAVAALRCSSWNKPRTQSCWGWRRSRSSFLCLLTRLRCLSSCSAATRTTTKKAPPKKDKELRGVDLPAYTPGDCWHKKPPNAGAERSCVQKRREGGGEEGWERTHIHFSIWHEIDPFSAQCESTENTARKC